MIHVFATVKIKPGLLQQALECYRFLVPAVMANEPGCIEYSPTVDYDLGLPNQERNECLIFVTECWASENDFRAHLAMAHCVEFRKRIASCLEEGIRIRVTKCAI